jgi:tight adherence protein B
VSSHGAAAQRVARRLQLMSGTTGRSSEGISILKQRRFSRHEVADRVLRRVALAHRLDQLLIQSGTKWSVEYFLIWTGVALLAGVFLGLHWPAALRAGASIVFALVPLALVRRARARRLARIEEQLPEAADFIARALRAGHSFSNVLQMAGAEMPDPLAAEFRAAHEEINYGVPMNEALHNLAGRIPLTDLRYLVIAVLIQRESGGNLAEILGNIAHLIRARLKLLAQVRVLSAEGRMSAWVLGVLPFAVMAVMSVANPGYISVLWTDPAGIRLLWFSLGMIVLGVLWLRRVIHIHV